MEIDYKTHYDDAYFQCRKPYRDANGETKTYTGPSLTWDGFDLVADALAMVLPKGTLLDIGCSAGDLAARLRRRGFDPYGVDVSKYAIEHTVPDMKGRTKLADISTAPSLEPFPDKYDVVLATDLLEHLYEEDLADTFKWMSGRSSKWMFFCVATDANGFSIGKGEKVPLHLESMAVAGHVNVRPWQYWARFFRAQGLIIRWDLMYIFQLQRELNTPWKNTPGWNMSTTFVLEKA